MDPNACNSVQRDQSVETQPSSSVSPPPPPPSSPELMIKNRDRIIAALRAILKANKMKTRLIRRIEENIETLSTLKLHLDALTNAVDSAVEEVNRLGLSPNKVDISSWSEGEFDWRIHLLSSDILSKDNDAQ